MVSQSDLPHFPDHASVEAFNLIPNPVWFFNVDKHNFWWGNAAAVSFWGLSGLDQLMAKDLSSDSDGIRRRVAQSFETAMEQGISVDPWTTYPNGKPKTIVIKHRAVVIGPERERSVMGIIFEDINIGEEPEHLLFVEAMRYTSVCVTSFFLDGAPVCQNPAAGAAYGLSVRDTAETSASVFVSRFSDAAEGREVLATTAGENAGGRFECLMNTLQGPRWHALDIRMSRHPLTGDVVMVVCEDDVTALREAVRAANAANDAKSTFLAVMSHELRTPLNGILGLTEALTSGDLSAVQREMLTMVQDSGKGLLRILDDILDLSKIEAGEMRLDPQPINLAELAAWATAFWRPTLIAKGLAFETACDNLADVPDVVGDPLRIRQVLSNFFSNAAKFTEAGEIRFSAATERQADGRVAVRFEVKDSGIGISDETQARLFSAFAQADSSTSRRYGGTGLGLNISRQLAELMGGSVTMESAAGQGSAFGLEILFEPARDAPESKAVLTDDQALQRLLEWQQGIRVLVADDNMINQKVIEAFLLGLPCDITFVADGTEALNAILGDDFDIVLMDCQMPVMDGLTATREIRSLQGPKRTTPVIVVTANTMPGDRERYLEAGLNDYVAKPIEKQHLYSAMARHLENDRSGAAAE